MLKFSIKVVVYVFVSVGSLLTSLGSSAEARPAAKHLHPGQESSTNAFFSFLEAGERSVVETGQVIRSRARKGLRAAEEGLSEAGRFVGLGPKPYRRWCGWFMRGRHGGGPQFNRAWAWASRGSPAEPHVGAVVVWRHHVGEIVGRASNGMWLVLSGNDGNRVRTRPRSLRGAVVRAL